MPTLNPIELTTKRLTLRWMNEADAEAHFAIHADPEVARYLSRPPWTELAQAQEAIRQTLAQYASGEGLRMGIVLRETGQLIGHASLFHFVDDSRRCLAPATIPKAGRMGCGWMPLARSTPPPA